MFERIARHPDVSLLVVYETAVEANRRWSAGNGLRYDHAILRSRTLDLRKLVSDAFVHLPLRPLEAARRFQPDVVVASEAWASPANIALWAGRSRHGWAMVSWWESFRRPRPSLPRRLAEPWVRAYARAADAWVAGGSRAFDNVTESGPIRGESLYLPRSPNLRALPLRLPAWIPSAGAHATCSSAS